MSAPTCPNCGASPTPAELTSGWCDGCGKRLPASFAASARPRPAQGPDDEAPRRPWLWPVLVLVVLALGTAAWYFKLIRLGATTDVRQIEQRVASEIARQGNTKVKEVSLEEESPGHYVGTAVLASGRRLNVTVKAEGNMTTWDAHEVHHPWKLLGKWKGKHGQTEFEFTFGLKGLKLETRAPNKFASTGFSYVADDAIDPILITLGPGSEAEVKARLLPGDRLEFLTGFSTKGALGTTEVPPMVLTRVPLEK